MLRRSFGSASLRQNSLLVYTSAGVLVQTEAARGLLPQLEVEASTATGLLPRLDIEA